MTFLLFTQTHSAIKHTFKKTNTINFSLYLFSQTFSATKHIFKETNTLNFSHKWDLAQPKKNPWSKDPTLTFLPFSPNILSSQTQLKETTTINFSHKRILNPKKFHDQRAQHLLSYLFSQTFSATKHRII